MLWVQDIFNVRVRGWKLIHCWEEISHEKIQEDVVTERTQAHTKILIKQFNKACFQFF